MKKIQKLEELVLKRSEKYNKHLKNLDKKIDSIKRKITATTQYDSDKLHKSILEKL